MAMTTDYCMSCGESPDSAIHWLPDRNDGCSYEAPYRDGGLTLAEVYAGALRGRIRNVLSAVSDVEQELVLSLESLGKVNPAAHDAWLLALQHLEPLRAAIDRARKAGEG